MCIIVGTASMLIELEFVADYAADVTGFNRQLVGDLALNGEIENIRAVGPEVLIENRSVARRGVAADAGEIRLGKRR